MSVNVAVDRDQVAAFCRRWRIREFALFGSVLREDLRPDSDVDVLVAFDSSAKWTLFDMVAMEDELHEIFGRNVDLVSRRGLEASRNYLRRDVILSSAEVLHVA